MCKKLMLFLAVMAAVLVTAGAGCAEEALKIGLIGESSGSEEAFNKFTAKNPWVWTVLHPEHEHGSRYVFYDSMIQLLNALNRGDVDEIDVAEPFGNYLVLTNPDYKVSCVFYEPSTGVAFGFLNSGKGRELQANFNSAIDQLKASGKLEALQEEYINITNYDGIKPVKFETFGGAETITAAVTGDLPPIDYVAAGGQAAGFNTALLAEIGRILKVNINLLNIETVARSAALTSGRADVVFWFASYMKDTAYQYKANEVNDEVILSKPYYTWDIYLQLRKKD